MRFCSERAPNQNKKLNTFVNVYKRAFKTDRAPDQNKILCTSFVNST